MKTKTAKPHALFLSAACFLASQFLPLDSSRAEEKGKGELAELEAFLEDRGIAVSEEGIQEYLQELNDPGGDRAVAKELIVRLGSERFADREAAELALMKLPAPPIDLLREVSEGTSLDAAIRARAILERAIPQQKQTVEKVLRATVLLEPPGLVKDIVQTVVKFQDEKRIVRAAKNAILGSVTKDDIPFISSQLSPEAVGPLIEIYICALRRLEDSQLADRFATWSRNQGFTEATRLESTLALADLGDRRSLDLLLALMVESDSAPVRARSQLALRTLTGQTFEYPVYAKPEIRIEGAASWQEWIVANGKTAKLNFPLRSVRMAGSPLNGHTLIALRGNNKVVEYDEGMKKVWEFDCKAPRTAEKMENGNYLISSYSQNRIIEVTPEKNIVRELTVEQVESARPLDNGNILITSNALKEVREIDPQGKTVWTVLAKEAKTGFFTDAIRLENGNTLAVESTTEPEFGHSYDIVEFDAKGNRIWERSTLNKSMPFIQALDNGHVLIAQKDSVIEVDKETDEVVWRLDIKVSRGGALKLGKGNLLIRQYNRILEVTPDGEEIWSKEGVSFGTMRR